MEGIGMFEYFEFDICVSRIENLEVAEYRNFMDIICQSSLRYSLIFTKMSRGCGAWHRPRGTLRIRL